MARAWRLHLKLSAPERVLPALQKLFELTVCLVLVGGSPLFSVESELRQTEFASGEVEHGNEMCG
jgi:hypothetical protein